MDNMLKNLHIYLATVVTNATSVVTVKVLVLTRVLIVNMATHLTKVTHRRRDTNRAKANILLRPTKVSCYYFFSLLSRSSETLASNLVIFLVSPFRLHAYSFSLLLTRNLLAFIQRVVPTQSFLRL
jgi:hypothetical protein